jgi:hypothetical protein
MKLTYFSLRKVVSEMLTVCSVENVASLGLLWFVILVVGGSGGGGGGGGGGATVEIGLTTRRNII